MINVSEQVINMLGQPARRIAARVELYECSTLQDDDYNRVLLNTFTNSDALADFKVERIADDGRFFGFGICQKLTVKLKDKDRLINVAKGQVLEVSFGVEDDYTYPCPLFQVEEVSRDENNNDLTIIAYDLIYKAGEHRTSEVTLDNYTISAFVFECARILNLPAKIDVDDGSFDLHFPKGGNFDGTETIREALNAVADATQTIFFVDWDWRLTFRRLNKDSDPVLHIDKSKYFELKNKTDRTLTTICRTTELNDNLDVTTGEPGVTQYVRDNAFWDLREDIDVMLNNALAAVGGMTISQFDCSWRGNFALEIGDKISMTTKDNNILVGYVLNDTLTYNGGLKEQTFWNFTEHNAETASNPITLGETIKKTYAKIDKTNKRIDLVADSTTSLIIESNKIAASVSEITNEVAGLSKRVDMAVTPTDVQIQIQDALSNGVVNEITTTTGFTFNNEGLTISKSGAEMNTTVSEDGMVVYRGADPMLIADHEGVNAMNLHATTYLYIGAHSLLQDYDLNSQRRTGCFWIEN